MFKAEVLSSRYDRFPICPNRSESIDQRHSVRAISRRAGLVYDVEVGCMVHSHVKFLACLIKDFLFLLSDGNGGWILDTLEAM